MVAVSPLETLSTAKLEAMPIDADVAEQVALQRAAKLQRDAMRLDREGDYRRSRDMHQGGAEGSDASARNRTGQPASCRSGHLREL